MNEGLKTFVIRDREEFFNLQEEWNSLLEVSENDNIFLRWEWLYNWWLVYGKGLNELFIITVREKDTLLGIAPLHITRRVKGFIREIKFIGSNIVASEYLDFILRKERKEDTLGEIISFLKKNSDLWDLMNFADIPSQSKSVEIIGSFFFENGIRIASNYNTCYYIDLKNGWESVYDCFAPELKNTIKRKTRKLLKFGDTDFYEVRIEDNLKDYFEKFLGLNELRMEMKGIRSPFLDRDFQKFHWLILKTLYPKGMARLFFLKIGDNYVASLYILYYKKKYLFYQSGFDPAWKWLSPGTLLFEHVVRQAHDEVSSEFDLLRGDEMYKSLWTKDKRTNILITIYNQSAKGWLLRKIEVTRNYLRKPKASMRRYVKRIDRRNMKSARADHLM